MKKITKLILLLCCSLMAVNAQAKLFSEDIETDLGAFSTDEGSNTDWTVAIDLFHDSGNSVFNAYPDNKNNIVCQNDVFDWAAESNSPFSFFADDYREFEKANSTYFTEDFIVSGAGVNIINTVSDDSFRV